MNIIKTEHNGAKNGGGYWGPREMAKSVCRSKRRAFGKREVVAQAWDMLPVCYCGPCQTGNEVACWAEEADRYDLAEEAERYATYMTRKPSAPHFT